MPQKGWTPLYRALMDDNFDAANILISYGANQFVKTNDGDTPKELLRKKSRYQSDAKLISDSAREGKDNFGFQAYAKGIYNTVKAAGLSCCVGLFAQWGVGKFITSVK